MSRKSGRRFRASKMCEINWVRLSRDCKLMLKPLEQPFWRVGDDAALL